MLTDLHWKLIRLDRKKDEVKKFFEEYKAVVNEIVKTHGINHAFQDDQGIVYQVVETEGKWVTYERFIVDRTKRPGETRGTLSLKKAAELGFHTEE